MNAIFHNDRVQLLGDYLTFLDALNVDGVVFGDPAVIMAAKENKGKPESPLSTETTGTNYYTCNYWGRKGATRAVLAERTEHGQCHRHQRKCRGGNRNSSPWHDMYVPIKAYAYWQLL
ncbi:U32 family peptidase [Bacillus sp. SL00103]